MSTTPASVAVGPAGEPTTIYVIDDHPLVRSGIVMVLKRLKPGADICELDKLDTLISDVRRRGPPILFCLDLKLPGVEGTEGVAKVHRLFPGVPLAVYSAEPAAKNEEACIEAGADTYMEKSLGVPELTEYLAGLLKAEPDLPDPAGTKALTKRQMELLVMLERGLANKAIAVEMEISEHTVKVHLWRLFRKLGAKNRTSAIHKARERGVLGL